MGYLEPGIIATAGTAVSLRKRLFADLPRPGLEPPIY
jgi:hypothetical protein